MSRHALRDFLRLHRDGVVATVFEGQPEAAVVGIAISDAGEIVFDALESTHKVRNLRRHAQIALTVWTGSQTAQVHGVADEPRGAELEALKAVYYAAFPDGPTRLSWPGITYVRIRPTWARFSDFGTTPARFEEIDFLSP